MTPSPLQLLDYWANSFRMEACPDFDPGTDSSIDLGSISVRHTVKKLDDSDFETKGSRWLVGLSIEQASTEAANIPYTFSLVVQGVVFALPGSLAGEKLARAVEVNGPSMLFGVAREMIRAATGRGPYPAVIIPSTHFLGESKERKPSSPSKKSKKKATRKTVARKTAKKKATRKRS